MNLYDELVEVGGVHAALKKQRQIMRDRGVVTAEQERRYQEIGRQMRDARRHLNALVGQMPRLPGF